MNTEVLIFIDGRLRDEMFFTNGESLVTIAEVVEQEVAKLRVNNIQVEIVWGVK